MFAILKDLNSAIDQILTYIPAGRQSEEVCILDALDRIVSRDVAARFSVPPFDTSAMDGFAVSSADLSADKVAGGSVELIVTGEAAAGSRADMSVKSGEAVKIMTGAPLPAGADAILIKENAVEEKGDGFWNVTCREAVSAGLHVRKTGADFSKNDIIIPRGTTINPAALGILASSGCGRVDVFVKRTVAVVSTGDELIDPLDETVAQDGFIPGAGRIMNSNLFLLYGLLVKSGLKPELCGIAIDTPEDIAKKISCGLDKADIVITTGGASVGSYDYIPAALELLGFKVDIWKMAIKPGRPFIFAVKKGAGADKIVFGLPGNPASSLVSFIKLLRPALDKYSGAAFQAKGFTVYGALSEGVKKDRERTTYLRAFVYNPEAGEGEASGNGNRNVNANVNAGVPIIKVPSKQDSNILTTALYANCLAEIPPGDGIAAKGDIVAARMI